MPAKLRFRKTRLLDAWVSLRCNRPARAGRWSQPQVGHRSKINIANEAARTRRAALLEGCLTMTYFRTGNPYYHWRAAVSRSCSGWEGVVPTGCGRQALKVGRSKAVESDCFAQTPARNAHGYGIKPHGLLVSVSSRHYCPSTPDLSTWWSATTLQGG
jgi:hypothetical protein